jgi:hypothetical protein
MASMSHAGLNSFELTLRNQTREGKWPRPAARKRIRDLAHAKDHVRAMLLKPVARKASSLSSRRTAKASTWQCCLPGVEPLSVIWSGLGRRLSSTHNSTQTIRRRFALQSMSDMSPDAAELTAATRPEGNLSDSHGDTVIVAAGGSDIAQFTEHLSANRHCVDVVNASRCIAGGHTANPWLLVSPSHPLHLFLTAVERLLVLEVSNGFRIGRGDPLRGLLARYRHCDVLEEILAKLVWQKSPPASVVEIPHRFEGRIKGDSKRTQLLFGYDFCLADLQLASMCMGLTAVRSNA